MIGSSSHFGGAVYKDRCKQDDNHVRGDNFNHSFLIFSIRNVDFIDTIGESPVVRRLIPCESP